MNNVIHKLGYTEAQVQFVIDTQLAELTSEAVKRIQFSPFDDTGTYIGHSGGKDSVLVTYLADKVLDNVMLVHTPKPAGVRNEVHPDTKEFLYSLNRPVLYLPDGSDFSKWGLKTQIDGTRAAEADRRDGRDVGVVVRGKPVSRADMPLYLEDGLFKQQYVYPIFDWTDLQVWSAIVAYNIPFSKEYE